MKVSIIGAGYVGLVTGAGLADFGHEVTVVDIDEQKIDRLQRGIIPIHEPGLERLIEKYLGDGRLSFTTDLGQAVEDADIHFITVWTPPLEDGRADVSAVFKVAEDLGNIFAVQKPASPIVVTKSTVPVGTGMKVSECIKKGYDGPVSVVSNPEFLREGQAVADMMRPDRIVVGSNNTDAARAVLGLYEKLTVPKIITDLASAEMIKYAANAFLATKISFANEIANVCERVGADIDAVKEGIGSDKRIGPAHLYAGMGYGGSCFPKDVRALQQFANEEGYDFKLLKSVIEVNEQQRQIMVEKLRKHLDVLNGKNILVLGLAFKSHTDDIRESAGIDLINRIQTEGANVRAYDPEAMVNAQKVLNDQVQFLGNPKDGVQDVDAIVIATEWPDFKDLDWGLIREKVRNPLIVDGRNLLDAEHVRSLGYTYEGFGRM